MNLLLSAVSLEGILRASHGLTHKFTGFFLTAETDNTDAKVSPQKYGDESAVGKFHIVMSAISKFSDKCRNLVTHTNSLPKSDVPVILHRPLLFFELSIKNKFIDCFRLHGQHRKRAVAALCLNRL